MSTIVQTRRCVGVQGGELTPRGVEADGVMAGVAWLDNTAAGQDSVMWRQAVFGSEQRIDNVVEERGMSQ
jgi:hypothetical protein